MKTKQIVVLVVAVMAVVTSLYFNFREPAVSENQRPEIVQGDLVKRAEYISLELRKMADQRSLWKLERCSAFADNFMIESSAEEMRKFSRKGWKIEKMTNTKRSPEIFDCHVTNDDGQKGIMVLKSPDQGRHWGIVCFKLS